jgi:histidine ammonia-lyase
MLLKAKALLR